MYPEIKSIPYNIVQNDLFRNNGMKFYLFGHNRALKRLRLNENIEAA